MTPAPLASSSQTTRLGTSQPVPVINLFMCIYSAGLFSRRPPTNTTQLKETEDTIYWGRIWVGVKVLVRGHSPSALKDTTDPQAPSLPLEKPQLTGVGAYGASGLSTAVTGWRPLTRIRGGELLSRCVAGTESVFYFSAGVSRFIEH